MKKSRTQRYFHQKDKWEKVLRQAVTELLKEFFRETNGMGAHGIYGGNGGSQEWV